MQNGQMPVPDLSALGGPDVAQLVAANIMGAAGVGSNRRARIDCGALLGDGTVLHEIGVVVIQFGPTVTVYGLAGKDDGGGQRFIPWHAVTGIRPA